MQPDFETAALRAVETLIANNVHTSPIAPLPFLKRTPGVLVNSFTETAHEVGMDRSDLLSLLATDHFDAVTSAMPAEDGLHYFVAYNQQLPFYLLQRAVARELGHILLRHDGSRPEDVRMAEAHFFACHLLCPRPLFSAVQETGIVLSADLICNMTGCDRFGLSVLKSFPGAHVPAELNRKLKDQFFDYAASIHDYYIRKTPADSAPADLGTYMDHYEE